MVSRRRQDRVVEIFMKRLRIKAASPEQKVGELSGGNQQKVLLARWLCLEPKVLLLDEPTRGIDVGAKAEVQALIDELAAEGLAVLLISSELEELVEGADRIVVLRAGAVAGELTGEDVSEAALLAVLAEGDPEGDLEGNPETDPETGLETGLEAAPEADAGPASGPVSGGPDSGDRAPAPAVPVASKPPRPGTDPRPSKTSKTSEPPETPQTPDDPPEAEL